MSEQYSNFVPLEVYSSPSEAHIVKGALEAEGIEVVMLGESMNDLLPINNTLLGGIRLMVHKDNLERAKSIIEENNSSAPEN